MLKRIIALIDLSLFWYIVQMALALFDANEGTITFFGQFLLKSWSLFAIGAVVLVNFILLVVENIARPKKQVKSES